MKLTETLPPTRKTRSPHFAGRTPTSLTLLGLGLLALGVLVLLVALPMPATADAGSTGDPGTRPGARETEASSTPGVHQVAAVSPTGARSTEAGKLKLGIVIYSTDAETVWNAFRFGVFALKQGDRVNVFLLAKGVDCEKLNTRDFDVTGQMQAFVDAGGKILACGTCLKLRQSEGTELCPIATMKDMYDVVKASDKVLTF